MSPDLPPPADLDAAEERPAFLDWFRSSEPVAPPEPPPTPPTPPAPPAPPEPPPVVEAPAPAEPASDVPTPLDEPLPPVGAYSWSSPPVQPRPPVAATAPMPKFTPTTWSAVITSDRTYYDRMLAEKGLNGSDLPFPARMSERPFALSGKQVRIGRRSTARGMELEIDLSEPPVDPGISRLHALLLPVPGGFWAVLDPGSANGTLLNGREIPPGDLIPLRDGDRINLGAWTAITIRRG